MRWEKGLKNTHGPLGETDSARPVRRHFASLRDSNPFPHPDTYGNIVSHPSTQSNPNRASLLSRDRTVDRLECFKARKHGN